MRSRKRSGPSVVCFVLQVCAKKPTQCFVLQVSIKKPTYCQLLPSFLRSKEIFIDVFIESVAWYSSVLIFNFSDIKRGYKVKNQELHHKSLVKI